MTVCGVLCLKQEGNLNLGFTLIFNSVLLGIGLAMDAFSVSLANGLNEPCMRKPKMTVVAGVFAFFQALMPLIGWICIHTIAERVDRLGSSGVHWRKDASGRDTR